jgi:TolA-binding protein
VLSLALALGFAFVRSRPESASRPQAAPVAKSAEPVLIRAESAARWSRWTEQHVERVVLESGSLSIRVQKASAARRVIVVLPDGELEDIGTTFSVSADGARTTRVTVEEGSVVLRLRDARPIVLGAGDSWPPSATPSTATSSASSAAPSPAPSSALRASNPAPVAHVAPDGRSDASADFRTALSALNAGDHAGAARLFTSFLSNHSRDARVEDAAYLRVIAFHRSGDMSATERAAGEYLKRFPNGFRRTEVEALEASSP